MIWRRFMIQSDKTLKDLHYVIQMLMGWTDYHLNEFLYNMAPDVDIENDDLYDNFYDVATDLILPIPRRNLFLN